VDSWRSLLARLEREALLLPFVALYVIFVLAFLPKELVQDGWLALLAGREVAENGLPHSDTLTVWAQGREWVDQQWLAQLFFYGLHAAGGLKLVMLANALLVAGAFALAVTFARRWGAKPLAVALVAFAYVFIAPWSLQMRAQSLAYPLFVGLLWLLAADSRSPSRRVFLVLPLLALWANLHGSVLLGAGLVGLHAVLSVLPVAWSGRLDLSRLSRAACLVAGPALCVFASPYGFALVGYYRSLFDPAIARYVVEWQQSVPSAATAAFYAVAAAALVLLVRQRKVLTVFEQAVLVAGIGAAGLAVRNIVWFALAALALLPVLVSAALPARAEGAPRRKGVNLALVGASVVAILAAVAVAASRPTSWYRADWPAEAVVAAVGRHPASTVFPSTRYADWLLFEAPQLRGRVVYDIRFELLTDRELKSLYDFRRRAGRGWQDVALASDAVVLDPETSREIVSALLARPGTSVAYRHERVVVLRVRR